ncbi:MAG: hypothetical protein ACRC3Y_02235 [Romboutsia sp.]|uniref:hypothetical protein n=1 Tax=Romboutsia sp. TaxID=1965302 RepID=UPI003F396889
MKRIDITSKAITLLTALSVVYAAIEGELTFVAPIVTLAMAYTLMKEKGFEKYNENKRLLNNLFLFNIVTFVLVSVISNNMNQIILDTVINIVVSFIYYKIIWAIENKNENIYKNPKATYKKLEDKIQVLEAMKNKLEIDMENVSNEKSKLSLETKLNTLNQKILQDKSKLEIIKTKIETQQRNSK